MSIYCGVLILSRSHHIRLCNVSWSRQSHPVIRCVITAQAVKTISSGSTWTQKDYSWYVLKPAASLDINPISGQFCNCEHTLKSSSPALGRPTHAWCLDRVELCWPGMTDGHWDTRDLQPLPPTDNVWWQQCATYKAEGRRRGRRRGRDVSENDGSELLC